MLLYRQFLCKQRVIEPPMQNGRLPESETAVFQNVLIILIIARH